MDRHTCKLCFRRFHNGRALGGHMRSHVMAGAASSAAAAAYSPLSSRQQSPPLSLASTSSTEMDDGEPAQHKPPTPCAMVLREGTKKRLSFPELSAAGGGRGTTARGGESSVVQDGESDTESSSPRFAVSRRRSKRARRRAPPPPPPPTTAAASDPEHPTSSVSDATTEEDVAMSLVMLSRDSWTRYRSGRGSEAEQNNDEDDDGGEDDDSGVRSFAGADHGVAPPRGGRHHHQCGVCKKVFRSYQALGGHRASIKRGKGGCVPAPVPVPRPAAASRRAENGPAVHECPFCFRVFESGQALGGHKRAHMPSHYAATATATATAAAAAAAAAPAPSPWTPAKCGDSSVSIDLNVPAATDDDFELSAVYDTEFGGSTHRQ